MLGRTDRSKNTLREWLEECAARSTAEAFGPLQLNIVEAIKDLDPEDGRDQQLLRYVATVMQKDS